MYGYRRGRSATRELTCLQRDGGNIPVSLPINIWSMQCLIAESRAEKMPFAAKIRRDGVGLSIELTNHSDRALREGCVRMAGNTVWRFGEVGPGQTRTFELRRRGGADWNACVPNRNYQRYVGDSPAVRFSGDQAYFARGSAGRTRSIESHLARGAAVVCARYDDNVPAGFTLRRERGTYNHVHMARLLVFPGKGLSR